MARTADKVTVIRFASGRELVVQPSPDEVVRAIRNAEGGLTRLLDTKANAAWINPEDIVTITSHRARRRRIGADKDELSELTPAAFSESAE
ncbi:MAG: hypothetical protein QOD14_2096 [Solirubrobacterales bacterium]|nr:hypothetical protein [Solirubrobacterales bacterium]